MSHFATICVLQIYTIDSIKIFILIKKAAICKLPTDLMLGALNIWFLIPHENIHKK